MCWSVFSIQLQALTLLKGDFSADAFLLIFAKVLRTPILQNIYNDCLCPAVEKFLTFIFIWQLSQSCLNKKQIAAAFPIQSEKSRSIKSHILFHNIVSVLCSACTPSIFQFFDLKYILPKTLFQRNSWFCSIYAYIFINISYLGCLDLVLCFDLRARTCSIVICISINCLWLYLFHAFQIK